MKNFIFIISIYFMFIVFVNVKAQESNQWDILNEGIPGYWATIDFVNDNTGWLSGSNTLLKTVDGGETWIRIHLPEDLHFEMFNMSSDSIGWALCDGLDGKNIFKTEDSGYSWQPTYKVPQSDNGYNRYKICAVNDRVVYIAGNYWQDGPKSIISKTVDGGVNWIRTLYDLEDRELAEIQVVNNEIALALGRVYDDRDGEYKQHEVCILRTMNGSASWHETILNEFTSEDVISHFQYVNDSVAFISGEKRINESDINFIYSSVDTGKTWSEIVQNDFVHSFYFMDAEIGYAAMRDSLRKMNIMKSTDGGNSWEFTQSSISTPGELFFINKDTIFILYMFMPSTFNALWKSTNGGNSWTQKLIYPFKDIVFIDNKHGFACGGFPFTHGEQFGGLFFTEDGGDTWQRHANFPYPVKRGGDYRILNACAFSSAYVGFLSASSRIYKTIDKGNSWSLCYQINPDSIGYLFGSNDISAVDDNIVFAVGHARWLNDSSGVAILGTYDGGENWDFVWKYPNTDEYSYELNSIHSVNTTAWAVGESGMIVKYTEQDHWQVRPSVTDLPLNDVFFSDEQHGWIAGGYSIDHSIFLKTINGGDTWQAIPGFNYWINDMFFEDSLHGWAVGCDTSYSTMILETQDGGDNWNVQVEDLSASLTAIHFKDGYGWAVGYNGLILRTYDGINWIDQNTGEIYPSKYSLSQNFPNPFNPYTIISYQLPKTSNIELSIYNILGQKVATLVSKKQSAGTYDVDWDASDFSSGLYFYRLETDKGYMKSRKLILLK